MSDKPWAGQLLPQKNRAPTVIQITTNNPDRAWIAQNVSVHGLWIKQNNGPTPNMNILARFGSDGVPFTWPTIQGDGKFIDFGDSPMTLGLFLNATAFAVGDVVEVIYTTWPSCGMSVT